MEDIDSEIEIQEALEEKQEKDYNAFLANIREVMKTESGKKFIWQILEECGIYSDMYTGNSQTYYLLGKKAVGLYILGLLDDADKKIYPKLLIENLDNEE